MKEKLIPILLKLLEDYKRILNETGAAIPIIYPSIYDDNGEIAVYDPVAVIYKTQENKTQAFVQIGMHCKSLDAGGIFITFDTVSREVKPENIKHVLKNYELERPSLYPESMVEKQIVQHYIDFEEKKFYFLFNKYYKIDNKYIFEKPQFLEENIDQPFLKNRYYQNEDGKWIKADKPIFIDCSAIASIINEIFTGFSLYEDLYDGPNYQKDEIEDQFKINEEDHFKPLDPFSSDDEDDDK